MQRRHAVRPGSTNGPTTAPPSTRRTTRWAMPVVARAGRTGSRRAPRRTSTTSGALGHLRCHGCGDRPRPAVAAGSGMPAAEVVAEHADPGRSSSPGAVGSSRERHRAPGGDEPRHGRSPRPARPGRRARALIERRRTRSVTWSVRGQHGPAVVVQARPAGGAGRDGPPGARERAARAWGREARRAPARPATRASTGTRTNGGAPARGSRRRGVSVACRPLRPCRGCG